MRLRQRRGAAQAAVAASALMGPSQTVMVNGVTGKMGFATAEAAVQRGLQLLPVAFSGPSKVACVSCKLSSPFRGV